MTFDLHI